MDSRKSGRINGLYVSVGQKNCRSWGSQGISWKDTRGNWGSGCFNRDCGSTGVICNDRVYGHHFRVGHDPLHLIWKRFSGSRSTLFIYLLKINLFIYLFLAALGLRCCVWAFCSCCKQGLLFVAVRGLLIMVASLVAEHSLQVHRLSSCGRGLQSAASVVAVHGLSCSSARGIFPDQGSNPCPLHWRADS